MAFPIIAMIIQALLSSMSGGNTAAQRRAQATPQGFAEDVKVKNPLTGAITTGVPSSGGGGGGLYNQMGGWQGILSSVMKSGGGGGPKPQSPITFSDPEQAQKQAFFNQYILPMLLKQQGGM